MMGICIYWLSRHVRFVKGPTLIMHQWFILVVVYLGEVDMKAGVV
jgi:hypothetical protein